MARRWSHRTAAGPRRPTTRGYRECVSRRSFPALAPPAPGRTPAPRSRAATDLLDPPAGCRLLIVLVVDVVVDVERADRHHAAEEEVDITRQPDIWKRLAHRHRGLEIGDAQQPRRRQEIEVHVVERVLDDLMRLRLDPDGDQRDLVHHLFDLGFVVFAAILLLLLLPLLLLLLLVSEQLGRVVL